MRQEAWLEQVGPIVAMMRRIPQGAISQTREVSCQVAGYSVHGGDTAGVSARANPRRKRERDSRDKMRFDALEPRVLLSTLYWQGGDGSWDDLNWNTKSDLTGQTIYWTEGEWDNDTLEAVIPSGSTVSLAGSIVASAVYNNGTLVLGGGNVIVGNFFNAGILEWTGGNGSVSGMGIWNNGTINLDGGTSSIQLGYIESFAGSINWDSGNVSIAGDLLLHSGSSVSLDGGTSSFSISGEWFINESFAGAGVWWGGGDVTVAQVSYYAIPYSYINLGSQFILDGGESTFTFNHTQFYNYDGTVEWRSGNLVFTNNSSLINDGYSGASLVLQGGGGNSMVFKNNSTLNNVNGEIFWNSSNVIFQDTSSLISTGGQLIAGSDYTFSDMTIHGFAWSGGNVTFENSTIYALSSTYPLSDLSGGGGTLTFDNSIFHSDGNMLWWGNGVEWNSGTIVLVNGSGIVADPFAGYPFEVPYGKTVTLDVEAGSTIQGTIVNYGTINWTGTGISQLAKVANNGAVVFESNPSLVALSGSSTATEGVSYTLTLGAVSPNIPATVTGFFVDWGDGWYDEISVAGPLSHTYGGTELLTTNYTISVHLMTASGVYIHTATKGVAVADVPPVVTFNDPTNGMGVIGTLPVISGTAGTSPGDDPTVTISIYCGGVLVFTDTADVDETTGYFSYVFDDSNALPSGNYTFTVTQGEAAGNTGSSGSGAFTVMLEVPQAVDGFDGAACGPTVISLSWSASPGADFVTGYEIFQSANWGVSFTSIASVAANVFSYDAMGLSQLSPYVFQIVAVNNVGSSDPMCTDIIWTENGIIAPDDVSISTVYINGVRYARLTWTDQSVGASYQVERLDQDTNNYYRLAVVFNVQGQTISCDILDNYVEDQTFRVRAVATGQSAYSEDVTTEHPNFGGSRNLSYDPQTGDLNWDYVNSNYQANVHVRPLDSNPGGGIWYPANIECKVDGSGEHGYAYFTFDHMAWPDGVEVKIWDQDIYGNPSYSNTIMLAFNEEGTAPNDFDVVETFDPQTDSWVYEFSWTPSGVSGETYVVYDIGVTWDDGAWLHNLSGILDHNTGFYRFSSGYQLSGHFAVTCYGHNGFHETQTFSNLVNLNSSHSIYPNTPAGFGARLTPGGISLTWDNNNNRETGYELKRYIQSTSNPNTWVADGTFAGVTLGADVTSYVDASATDGLTYRYTIAAVIGAASPSSTTTSGIATTTANAKPELTIELIWRGASILDSSGNVILATGALLTNHAAVNLPCGAAVALEARILVNGVPRQSGVKVTWDLGGADGIDYCRAYIPGTPGPVPVDEPIGKVVKCGPLKRPVVTFYWVTPQTGQTFKATTGDGLTATATFDFWKPDLAVVEVHGPVRLTSNGLTAKVSTTIVWLASPPTSGSLFFVQLVKSVRTCSQPGGGLTIRRNTEGDYWLDTTYPYGGHFDPKLGAYTASDEPSWRFSQLPGWTPLGLTFDDHWSIRDDFKTWLMWQSDSPGSIPVPLSVLDWSWTAIVDCDRGYLVDTFKLTSSSMTVGTWTDTTTYPEWKKVMKA